MTTPTAPPFDICGLICTGQSTMCGNGGSPVLSTVQPFANEAMIDLTNTYATGNPSALSTTPAVAGWRGGGGGDWGHNVNGEDPGTSIVNAITAWMVFNRYSKVVHVNHHVAISGTLIANISRGGGNNAYAATRAEVQRRKALANLASKTYGIPGLFMSNGEADASNSSFATAIKTLYDQYASDLLTDSGNAIGSMFITQQCSTPTLSGGAGVTISAVQQLLAHTTYPGVIILAGPKYQLPFSDASQHYTSKGYQYQAEIYARSYIKKVLLGQTWEPLRPTSFAVSGAQVTITFNVPVGNLVFDTTFTPPHASGTFSMWANGKGFEARDHIGNLTINSVVISGNAVVLTLSAPPSTGLAISYAYTADTLADGTGTNFVARGGLLKDQAWFLSTNDLSPITGSKLANWGVTFDQTGLT